MNIYLLTRDDDANYDEYEACVVCAETEEDAKQIHPDGGDMKAERSRYFGDSWVLLDHVKCRLIGIASSEVERGVICTDFRAG